MADPVPPKPTDADFSALPPGAGGWVPAPWMPWAAGGITLALSGVGTVLLAIPGAQIAGAVLLALAPAFAALAGVSSAGPRRGQ